MYAQSEFLHTLTNVSSEVEMQKIKVDEEVEDKLL